MSGLPEFVRELFAAANQIDLLTPRERRRLIERAANTIGGLREQIATDGRIVPLVRDITGDLPAFLRTIDTIPPVLIAVTMNKCADEILRLKKIVLELSE